MFHSKYLIKLMIVIIFSSGCVPSQKSSSTSTGDSAIKKGTGVVPIKISYRQLSCAGALPLNAKWNANKATFTQTQNGDSAAWLPASSMAAYNINGSNECEFKCDASFDWISATAQCVSNAVVVKQISCGGVLPLNSTWNAGKNTFTQTQSASSVTPVSVNASYNANGTNECQYRCKVNYTYNNVSSLCVANSVTVKCTGVPDVSWNYFSGDDTFVQTWDGAVFLPAQMSAMYSATNTASACEFMCKTNYTWDNVAKKCSADVRQLSCNGSLPSNAMYNSRKNTFLQTWNGTVWLPASLNSTYSASGTGDCLFSCNADYGYILASNTCEKKTVVLPPVEDNSKMSIPANAVFVPYSKRDKMQIELDKNKIIYLESQNYAYANRVPNTPPNTWGTKYPALHVTSGQQIYGMPGTEIPELIIEPGSTDILIRGISAGKLTFPTSNLVTRGNTFQKLRYTGLYCVACTIEDNAFYDLSWTGIDLDFTTGGHMRNNRFTRTLMQGGKLQMKIWGNANRSSYANTFLFVNFLTPEDATDIKNLDDFTIIGFDAESYAPGHALLRTREMGSLRILGGEGNSGYQPNPNGEVVDASINSGVIDSNADEIVLMDMATSSYGTPSVILREQNKLFFDINSWTKWSFKDLAANATRFRIYSNLGSFNTPELNKIMLLNNIPINQELSAAQKDKIPKFLYDDAAGQKLIPWPKLATQVIPDPLGASWRQVAASCPDVSDQLQARLDAEKVIKLAAGTYCVSKSLKVQLDGGIIGSGMHKTILLAKNQNIDIITPKNWVKEFFGTLTLLDITLQGGKSGLRVDGSNIQPGGGGILNGLNFGYVVFRDFAEAGMFFTAMFGVDNNFLDNIYFVNNKYGLYAISLALPSGATENDRVNNSTYVDKTVFHQCQFINNQSGVHIGGFRANNLILFSDSLFKDNVENAGFIANASRLTFTNTVLDNNGGNPSIQGNASIYILNSHFIGGPLSKTMLGSDRHNSIIVEGSTFERGSADSNARIFTDGGIMPCNQCHPSSRLIYAPGFVGFYNSNSIDIGLGGPVEYVGINSLLPLNPTLNKKLVVITGKTKSGGVPKTIVYDSDLPNPSPRFLTIRAQ